MAKCLNGHEVSDDARFCSVCGATATQLETVTQLASPPTPEVVRTLSGGRKSLVAAIIVALGIAAWIGSAAINSGSPSEAERALGAEGRLSSHDVSVLGRLSGAVRSWNTAAEPFVAGYIDPNVSAERWVREATAHITAMRASATDLRTMIITIEDGGLRRVLLELADSRMTQLGAVVELHNAVARGDIAGEQAAFKSLQSASARTQELGLSMLDRIRPFADPADLEDAFR